MSPWPQPKNYRAGRVSLVEEAIAASTFPDAAFKGTQFVGKKGTTMDELRKSYLSFSVPPTLRGTLDAKLAAAISRTIS